MKPSRLVSEAASSHARAHFNLLDIEGAQSLPKNRLVRRTRNTNPLCPIYKFPNSSYIEAAATPTKFLKDSLDIGDIDGTKVQTIFGNLQLLASAHLQHGSTLHACAETVARLNGQQMIC